MRKKYAKTGMASAKTPARLVGVGNRTVLTPRVANQTTRTLLQRYDGVMRPGRVSGLI